MDSTVLERITQDLEKAPTREHFDAVLRSAFAAGWTLQSLGDIVGVSREAIRMRLRRSVPAEMLVDYSPPTKVTEREKKRRCTSQKRKRILGIRISSPVMQVPVATLNQIASMRESVSKVRGWTPLDAPEREMVRPFGDLLFATVKEFQIPETHLEKVLGLSPRTCTAWLRRHGYLPNFESQKSYKGVDTWDRKGARRKKKTIVPGGTCRAGHKLTEADIATNGTTGNRTCRICRNKRSLARYHERKRSA